MRILKAAILLIILYLFPLVLQAQNTGYITVESFTNKDKYALKDTVKAGLKVNIKEKFHINSYETNDPTLIKTTISVKSDQFKLANSYFPPDKLLKFEFSQNEVRVYEGEIYTGVTLIPSEGLAEGEYKVPVSINYQACDDKVCYPPKSAVTELTVRLSSTGSTAESNTAVFKNIDFTKPSVIKDASETNKLQENPRTNAPTEEAEVSNFMEEKGLALGLILIFLGGLALNLTPCVYPLIPITISYFGGRGNETRTKGQSIMMGVFYALGMSVTYSSLGLFAALTGSLLGTALQNPFVIIGVALVLIALGTSMFGLFEIRVPQKLALAGNKERSGYFGSMMMGLLVGFIAAPCIGPFVLSLLVYVGQIGNAFMGFFLFFVLSLGLGAPYIVLAAFSSSLNKLPRSGEWMEGVKIIFGLILFGMALSTLEPVIPKDVFKYIYPGYIILAGVYLILIDRKGTSSAIYSRFKYLAAVAAIIWGTWILKPSGGGEELKWNTLTSLEQVEGSIKNGGKPIMIDFYADWCAQCKELDKFTYTDKEIIDLSKSLNNIKIDLTKEDAAISDKFGIRGLPVVIFMNSKGEELRDLRVTGFLEPEEFKKKINSLLETENNISSR